MAFNVTAESKKHRNQGRAQERQDIKRKEKKRKEPQALIPPMNEEEEKLKLRRDLFDLARREPSNQWYRNFFG